MNDSPMLFLLPPSEGKQGGGTNEYLKCSFVFDKPLAIASHATQKDLKCVGKRYQEGLQLNATIEQGPFLSAIQRYTGVMFKAIGYHTMSVEQQQHFNQSVLILSGMYGLLRPTDQIANYKLPIGTKGLLQFRSSGITQTLNTLPKTQIIDLLPGSYKKMIQRGDLNHDMVHVDFFQDKKKLTHAVKGVKGRWLYSQIVQSVENKNYSIKKGTHRYEDEKGLIQVVVS